MLLETQFLANVGVELPYPKDQPTAVRPGCTAASGPSRNADKDKHTDQVPGTGQDREGWGRQLWSFLASVRPSQPGAIILRPRDQRRHSERLLRAGDAHSPPPTRPRVAQLASTLSVSRLGSVHAPRPGSVSRFIRSLWGAETSSPLASSSSPRPSFTRARTLSFRRTLSSSHNPFHRRHDEGVTSEPESEPSAPLVRWTRPEKGEAERICTTSPFIRRRDPGKSFVASQGIAVIYSTPLPPPMALPMPSDVLRPSTHPGPSRSVPPSPSPRPTPSRSPRVQQRRVTSLTIRRPIQAKSRSASSMTLPPPDEKPLAHDTGAAASTIETPSRSARLDGHGCLPLLALGDDAEWGSIAFFRALRKGGDVHLGQVVETLSLAAAAMHSDDAQPAAGVGPCQTTEQTQYGREVCTTLAHNGYLVTLSARALRPLKASVEPGVARLDASSTGNAPSGPVPEAPTQAKEPEPESDEVRAVAELLQVGPEPARQALRLADRLVRRAKRDAEAEIGIDSDVLPQGQVGPIAIWSVVGHVQSEIQWMNAGSYLWSLGKFVETLIYHSCLSAEPVEPSLPPSPSKPTYFFRTVQAVVRATASPFRLYKLQLQPYLGDNQASANVHAPTTHSVR